MASLMAKPYSAPHPPKPTGPHATMMLKTMATTMPIYDMMCCPLAPVLHALAHRQGIAMPIVEAVCRLLNGEAPAKLVVAELLARPLTTEGVRL